MYHDTPGTVWDLLLDVHAQDLQADFEDLEIYLSLLNGNNHNNTKHTYIHTHLSLSLSLSPYIYIYTYTYVHIHI